MKLTQIERKATSGELNAVEVFTSMKKLLEAENKLGWNGGVNAAAELVDDFDATGETIRNDLLST